MLAQQIASGLVTGSLYALVALGLVLVYKVSGVVNFAHGEMTMTSTFIAWILMEWYHLPKFVAFLGAVAFGALLGALAEIVIMRQAKDASHLELIVATLGLASVLYGSAGAIFGWDTKGFPYAMVGRPLRLGPVIFTRNDLFVMGLAVLLALAAFAFFGYTDTGIALRAMVQNLVAAQLMGVAASRMLTLTWAISSALGALAGVLIAPSVLVDPNMMGDVIVKAFTAAVLGGFTSLAGVIVGGISLGVIENLVAGYISTELKATFAFALILVILAIRPAGLLGQVEQRKV